MTDWIEDGEVGSSVRGKLNSIPNDGTTATVATAAQGAKADTALLLILYGGASLSSTFSLVGIQDVSGVIDLTAAKTAFSAIHIHDCYAVTGLLVGANVTVTDLTCYSNGSFSSLDITGCTALTNLRCSNLGITSIDLSQCTMLTQVNVESNNLSGGLDISALTSLQQFICDYCQLTTLDVSNNPALTDLEANNNLFTESAVDAILATLDGFGQSNGFLELQNGSSPPSASGLISKASLEGKGWTVFVSS